MYLFKKILLILLPCFEIATSLIAETPSSTDEEIIHYAFFLDKDIAFHEYVHDLQKELATKIEQTIPNAIVSCLDYTTQDLADADKLAYGRFDLEKSFTSMENNFCSLESLAEGSKYTHHVCTQHKRLKPLIENIEKSHRTIIIIEAHGGNYPYTVGEFCPEKSYLANRHNVEFVILSCLVGNINLNDKIKSKITGASRQNEVYSGIVSIAFMEYLNADSITVPTSALDFYENLRKIQRQCLVVTLFFLFITSEYIEGELHPREYLSYWIDSLPAQAIEMLSAIDFLPGNSESEWYADPVNSVHHGEKITPWFLIPNAESISVVLTNIAIITGFKILRIMILPTGVMHYTCNAFIADSIRTAILKSLHWEALTY